jgi:hypothetical protein
MRISISSRFAEPFIGSLKDAAAGFPAPWLNAHPLCSTRRARTIGTPG